MSTALRSAVRPTLEAAPVAINVPAKMLEACRAASLQMGGPTLAAIGVTSAIRGEGRSSIATAMALIQRDDYGRKVIVIDMDLENPSLDRRFGVRPWPGLAEAIRGQASVAEIIQEARPGLSVITTGAPSGGAPRLMLDLTRSELLKEIAKAADVVVADLPPLASSSFGRLAAGMFPHLLLVVWAGVTPLARLREATAGLPTEPVAMLNASHSSLPAWTRRVLGM
jgi:Mrp family chromosome partitioning ATPase